MASVIGDKAMNKVVSHLEEVNKAVWEATEEIGGKAEALLAAHRRTGEAKIEVTFETTDGWVNLVDPAALSIEFGHWMGEGGLWHYKPKFVRGLHVIGRAAGLL